MGLFKKLLHRHTSATVHIKPNMPMGALTYAIACSHCKNQESDLCEACVCEIKSGFKLDPDTLPAAPGIWLEEEDELGVNRGWKCSVCRGSVYEMTSEPYQFCPHCGAKITRFTVRRNKP